MSESYLALGLSIGAVLGLVYGWLIHYGLELSAKARTATKIRGEFYMVVLESDYVDMMLKARAFEQLQEACEKKPADLL